MQAGHVGDMVLRLWDEDDDAILHVYQQTVSALDIQPLACKTWHGDLVAAADFDGHRVGHDALHARQFRSFTWYPGKGREGQGGGWQEGCEPGRVVWSRDDARAGRGEGCVEQDGPADPTGRCAKEGRDRRMGRAGVICCGNCNRRRLV